MPPSDDLPPELSIDALRRLARGLVFERGSADDLVQDAWLAALETRGEIAGVGAWLAGAVRRLARNRAREERRRDRRERAAARPEAQPSTLETSARIELLHRLLAAVDRLEAPYRTAIVLRYFDDLPPRSIAARLGIPVNTARTHVRRGIERLRADLDADLGREREAFLAALAPFLAGTRKKGLPMQTPVVLATSVLVLGAVAWMLGQPSAPGPGPVELVTAPGQGESAPADPAPVQATSPASGAGSTQGAPTPQGRTALTGSWTIRGRVTRGGWEHADPYPGARLVGRLFAGGKPEGTALVEERFQADGNGNFAWSPATPTGLFSVAVRHDMPAHSGWPLEGWFLPGDPAPQDWSLDLYPFDVTIRGTVRAPDGAPLAGAFVGRILGDEQRAVRSGSDGTFVLGCPCSSSLYGVIAWQTGFAPGYAGLRPSVPGAVEVEITLGQEVLLRGTVRDPSGKPIAGAEVAQSQPGFPAPGPPRAIESTPLFDGAWPRVTTDANGRYEIGGIHGQAQAVLLSASAPGFRSTEELCARRSLVVAGSPSSANLGAQDWYSKDFTLEPARVVTLTGRVRAAGAPVEAAWVSVVGEEPPNTMHLEGEIVEAWCDADGRFTLDRAPCGGSQTLRIKRLGFVEVGRKLDVHEGISPLELELVPGHSVGGLVLGLDGAPMPGAWVWADTPIDRPMTYTDDGGRFRITDLPGTGVTLAAEANGCRSPEQEAALDREDHVLHLEAKVEPAPPAIEPPVAPVTAATGTARLNGRLLDLAGNVLAQQTIELVAAEAKVAGQPGLIRTTIELTPAEAKDAAKSWHATTDAHGVFAFSGLPAGTFDVCWQRSEAGLTVRDLEQRLTLAADEARELELQPRGSVTLQGTIEFMKELPPNTAFKAWDKNGAEVPPVLGDPPEGMPPVVTVRLFRLLGPAPSGQRGVFAHEGRFVVEGLEPGRWAVEAQVQFSGKKFCPPGTAMVTLPESGSAEVRVLVMPPQPPR